MRRRLSVAVVLRVFLLGLAAWSGTAAASTRHVPLSDIDWQASLNQDEDAGTPSNHAEVKEYADGSYAIEWTSPEPVDFDLNGLGRLDWDGAVGFEIELSASEAMEVDVWIGVGREGAYCGKDWRYALLDRPLGVGTEPATYSVSVTSFSEDPEGDCDGLLDSEALEGIYSIILWPSARNGELRVHGLSICLEGVPGSSTALEQKWDEGLLPVLDDFSTGSGLSAGGTLWHLSPGVEVVSLGQDWALRLQSTETAWASAELPLAGLPLDAFDGFYVLASGSAWGQVDAEILANGAEGRRGFWSAQPIVLNEEVREFRIPFVTSERVEAMAGDELILELRNTYGAAEATILQIGLFTLDQPAHDPARQLLWITPLPKPDPTVTEVGSTDTPVGDLTLLGNPFALRFPNRSGWEHARSVWDMHLWQDRVYLGHGDGHSNAGPTDVWYLDLARNTFVKQTTIDEEEIRSFVETGETLCIPGFDPREHGDSPEWEWGNLYSYGDSAWTKQRTVPWGLHLYDVLLQDGLLFASGDGSEAYVREGEMKLAFCHVSADQGKTWELHYPSSVNRLEELFALNDTVYASGAYDSLFLRWNGEVFVPLDVEPFPDLPPFTSHDIAKSNAPMLPPEWKGDPTALLRAGHVTQWLDGVLYSCNYPYTRQASEVNGTRHVPESLGLYFADEITDGGIERLDIAPDDMMPRDVVVRDHRAYVLFVGKELDSQRAAIYRGTEKHAWELVFSSALLPAPAYSMEVANDRIFLGLGGPGKHSGEIYAFELP
jgi:hypothetical protein